MKPIIQSGVQEHLNQYINKPVYVHLETTNGAYASHLNENAYTVGAFIRNVQLNYTNAKIVANDNGTSYRAGLKLEMGWIYAEGLTDWEVTENGQLLLAGHNDVGRLMVALQISEEPFRY